MIINLSLHPRLAIVLLCMVMGLGCCFEVHGQDISTYAGAGYVGYTGNGGSATLAKLDSPTAVATDAAGNVYISDEQNNCVRMVSPSGVITTVAGTATGGINADGIPATNALLSENWGIAVDAAGNLYIADQSHYTVRKVNTAGIISTIAGNGTPGNTGNGGAATNAQFKSPLGIAVDGAGNVYVGDYYSHCVRKISPAGIITAFAGNGGYGFSGDGGAALTATFRDIYGLGTDAAGNVYICDGGNNRVRKVDASGIITTIAGTDSAGYGGDTGPATAADLNSPTGVCVTTAGVVYISDFHNNRIRRISASGIITTIAGTGVMGFLGDGSPALGCEFSHPIGVALDNERNIFVADLDNLRIRKIDNINDLTFTGGHLQSLAVCENTVRVPISSLLAITDLSAGSSDRWSIVSGPAHGTAVVAYTATSTGGTYAPLGLSYTPVTSYLGNDTLVVRASNGTSMDTTTLVFTIIPPVTTAGIITGPSRVCVGLSVSLSDTTPGGVWASDNGSAAVSGGVVTGIAPGTDTITYTVENACSSRKATQAFTVDALPPAGVIVGPTAVCANRTIVLTDTITGGIWSISNVNATIIVGIVTGKTYGYDTVTYTVSNSFCTAFVTYALAVDTFASPPAITGIAMMCANGGVTQLQEADSGGVWSISNTNASYAVVDSNTITVTGLTAGTDNISYSISNSCGTGVAVVVVTIDPLPNKPVIQQQENILDVQGGYASYQWGMGGVAIPGAVTDTYVVQTANTYEVIVTNQYGCVQYSDTVYNKGCDISDISIFPDPATNKVNVAWCKKINIKLYTMDGKLVMSLREVNEIDISGLPNAMYLLAIYDVNWKKITNKKIVKTEN